MYNFQTSKDLHDILINFLEKKAKVVEDEPNKNQKILDTRKSKFDKANISFTKYGGINAGLDDKEMMKVFKNVMEHDLEPPAKVDKPLSLSVPVTVALSPVKEMVPLSKNSS